MKRQLIQFATAAALAAGMAFAQTPAPATANQPSARHNFVQRHMARMAQELNLSDAQKQQAKSIFQNARTSSQPIREQLKQNREALNAAAKEGKSEAEIQRLAAEQGNLVGKMAAIRTEAFGKFYSLLTPEQRAKADQMQQQLHQRTHNRQRANG